MPHEITMAIALALDIVGLVFLANEVRLGHNLKKTVGEFDWLIQMQFLYAAKDFEKFYVTWRLEQGDTAEAARQWIELAGTAAVEKAVEDEWKEIAPRVTKAIRIYKEVMLPAIMRTRRWYLWTGTALLVVAAILHFIV